MQQTERFLIVLKDLIAHNRNMEAIKLIEMFQKTYFPETFREN